MKNLSKCLLYYQWLLTYLCLAGSGKACTRSRSMHIVDNQIQTNQNDDTLTIYEDALDELEDPDYPPGEGGGSGNPRDPGAGGALINNRYPENQVIGGLHQTHLSSSNTPFYTYMDHIREQSAHNATEKSIQPYLTSTLD
ncbi:MAG: hypothetical protein K2X94_04215 [Amoebophilaceae bacterium]|nr:hypothetical protein [Amoebophilaceae bacterium]